MKHIEIHGVPMDLGAALRGVDMGPSALRIAGIVQALHNLGYKVADGNPMEIVRQNALPPDNSRARYLDVIAKVCRKLHDSARESRRRGAVPVFLGGDHSLAAGSVRGVASWCRERKQDLGVIWFDAHADMNTPETTPSGNVHGMALAALLGLGPPSLASIGGKAGRLTPDKVYMVGTRRIDAHERDMVTRSGIHVFSMKDIDTLGMAEVTHRAIEGASRDTAGIYLSFDIDGLDPGVAPGVGTPVRGGVDYREAHLFMEMLADSGKLLGMDVVELNPVKDVRNETAELAVHLIQSAFGYRII